MSNLSKATRKYMRQIGSKGGKASAERGGMAERGSKGASVRWAGHIAKRPSKRKP